MESNTNKWIKFDDNYPKKDQLVVAARFGNKPEYYFGSIPWDICGQTLFYLHGRNERYIDIENSDLTHWLPLPKLENE